MAIDGRALTPEEEKVLRMRHGIPARGFTRLEKSSAGHPATEEQLARLEQRLLAAQHKSDSLDKPRLLSTLSATKDAKKS